MTRIDVLALIGLFCSTSAQSNEFAWSPNGNYLLMATGPNQSTGNLEVGSMADSVGRKPDGLDGARVLSL